MIYHTVILMLFAATSIYSLALQFQKPGLDRKISSADKFSHQRCYRGTNRLSASIENQSSMKPEIFAAIETLKQYDSEYLQLLKQARSEGRPVSMLQLEKAQNKNGETIKAERDALRSAVLLVTKESELITLGIMAESGGRAVRTLKAWVSALELPRGILRAVEESSGEELEICSLAETAVYLKYGPQLSGDAYMKAYAGGNIGVIFQPKLKSQSDEDFFQFGDLPLSLFI